MDVKKCIEKIFMSNKQIVGSAEWEKGFSCSKQNRVLVPSTPCAAQTWQHLEATEGFAAYPTGGKVEK